MKAKFFDARRVLSTAAGLGLVALLNACGGGSGPTDNPTPSPTPTPCTQTTVFQAEGQIPASTLDAEPFTTTTAGRLDVTVDWTIASSTIGVYVVPSNSCSLAQFNARTCNFLLRSDSGPKPRRVSAGGVASGAYDLLLANYANQQESLSALVVLSSASCPAISAVTTSSRTDQTEVAGQTRGLFSR